RSAIMQLPALKNAVPVSLIDGQSIEDFIRNSTQNLQRAAAAMPGSGIAGAVYLGFDGTSGVWKLNREPVDAKSLGRILVPQHGLFEGCIEWANRSRLQKIQRQLLGVHYDEPMSERLLPKPLSPNTGDGAGNANRIDGLDVDRGDGTGATAGGGVDGEAR